MAGSTFSRNEVAPVVYDYAVRGAEGRTPAGMLETLQETFAKTVQESRAAWRAASGRQQHPDPRLPVIG